MFLVKNVTISYANLTHCLRYDRQWTQKHNFIVQHILRGFKIKLTQS